MKFGFFRTAIVIAVCTHSSAPHALAQDGTRALTLEEAIRLAQQSAPAMVTARNSVHTSESAVRASLSQFIPTLNFSYSGDHARE